MLNYYAAIKNSELNVKIAQGLSMCRNTEDMRLLGAELARKMFEQQYGSTMQSYLEIGKQATVKRIENCNESAGIMVNTILKMMNELTTEQLKDILL